jgi:ubiquinone/menaquinone biosynthesis C-methylase UbiE
MTKSTTFPRGWQQASRVFQERADEYDSWYDNSMLFANELSALQQITLPLAGPIMEIGAGPGRFAEQLAVTIGIDPAPATLQRAQKRGIMGIAGIGEQLPIRSKTVGTVFILFTLCFLVDPPLVLDECRRILKKDGHLVIGQVPALSAWGRLLDKKRENGNEYYKYARFYSISDTLTMLEQANFTLQDSHSTLLQPPGKTVATETSQPGINEQAGFCVLVAEKQENT